ncbi:MAG TPA: ribonuclease P protein component [Candidatus Rhabdochlamydia sp.]|jgi:ribonuclease P protein component|nr:ribonuclease P protein component [Candidatus Rhabdochlamydia sp.]
MVARLLIDVEEPDVSALPCNKSWRFPKSARILKSSHFRRLTKSNRRIFGEMISVDFQHSKGLDSKLGITVSKKFGKAHDRNRFKRVVREVFREMRAHLPIGLEINISPCSRLSVISKQIVFIDLKRIVEKIVQSNSNVTLSSS